MYLPSLARYTPVVTAALQEIAAASSAISSAAILPAQEEILRRDALVGSVHYSNLLEGNELPAIESRRAVEHELDSSTKAKLELVNYVAALEWIEERRRAGEIVYTSEFLQELHGIMSRGLGRPGSRFEPHHEGAWRDGLAVVGDPIAVFHAAPPPEEVDSLMRERLAWLESRRTNSEYFGPILAAIAHFEVTDVHPFADYNGRTARLFAVAVLLREEVAPRALFSPERYYAEDRDAYTAALRDIKKTRTLNAWLEYYVTGLASELSRVAERVDELNRLSGKIGGAFQLSSAQDRIIAELTAGGRRDITRPEVEVLTGLRRTGALDELTALVEAGVLRPVGSSRRRTYELAAALRPASPAPTGRPRWTDERIAFELAAFAKELGYWPRHADFVAAGRTGLYIAASKRGGLKRWQTVLG